MSDERLRELFGQIATMTVDVPPAGVAEDRCRRRRGARLRAASVGWTIVLAGGVGAPQAATSMALHASSENVAASPQAGQGLPLKAMGSSAPRSQDAISTQTLHASPRAGRTGAPGRMDTTSLRARSLPPPGTGQLLLGLDTAGRFVMTRIGSATAPVSVAGLAPAIGAPSVLVTNPAGGWVVVISSPRRWRRVSPTRLALVAESGRSEPFGPLFVAETVTSAAVNPRGSRVAVALSRPLARPRIEVVPLPGHRGADRTWRLRSVRARLVTSLSWAPDGRHLTYLAGRRSRRGPITLDLARRRPAATATSGWPLVALQGARCVPDVTAWLGRSRRFGTLEHCARSGTEVFQPAGGRTGAPAGRAVVVARRGQREGCGPAALDPNPAGGRVLISYCGIYLDDNGKLTKAPGGLTAAALSG